MREILFCGKAVDNGEFLNCKGKWVEGGITFFKGGIPYICPERFSDYDEEIEVDPETVSEFTGLTDKNGKRIFEGNLLKITSTVFDSIIRQLRTREDIALVEYDSKTGGYRLKVYNNGEYKRISKFSINHLWAYNAEVVGNKWDNPDLLKRGKQ